jgi:hypothetical protein
MKSMADLTQNHFASVIGKSEVLDFVKSLRKTLGSWRFALSMRGIAGGRRFANSLWPVRTDPFSFILLALEVPRLHQNTSFAHLQPNAYHVLTKNLSDLAAVSKTALEHTVALL